jgi:plastocyanin
MEGMTMRKASAVPLGTIVLLMAAVVGLYSCGSSTPNTNVSTVSSAFAKIVTCPPAPAKSVAISNFLFQPGSVTIAVNDIVQWTNNDSTPHTVTSGTPIAIDGKFDSGQIAPNTTVCVQFLATGTYQYFCNIHPSMVGAVTVQ